MLSLLCFLFSASLAGPTRFPAALSAGDTAFLALHYDVAASMYGEALSANPDSPDILWRFARLSVAQGEVWDGEKAEAAYRQAEKYARRCTESDSTCGEGHTWLAVALGEIAMFEGSKTKIRLCGEITQELDRALALNPRDDIAWSIRGSFYRALGNVSWIEKQIAALFIGKLPDGGYSESETALLEAIRLAPNVLRHRRELGLLYVDWGKTEEARRVLQESLSLPVLLAGDVASRERIRLLLLKLD